MKNNDYAYLKATGKVGYNMTNDYMFRTVLQKDNEALAGLVASVMSLKRSDIQSVVIENPIVLGEVMSDKEFRLDILATLNDHTRLNLEMQVHNYNDWPNRSLVYLCREFDSLSHGELYSDLKPVYQVSFIDFTLFDDHPEFFGKYQMRNARDGYLYNSNFNLYVIELNSTDIALEADKISGLDKWVNLFKASTWEEIRMITKDNPSMISTAESIYVSNSDKLIQKRCREREDFYFEQEAIAQKIKQLEASNSEKDAALAEKDSELKEQASEIAEKDALLKKYIDQFGEFKD